MNKNIVNILFRPLEKKIRKLEKNKLKSEIV